MPRYPHESGKLRRPRGTNAMDARENGRMVNSTDSLARASASPQAQQYFRSHHE